LPPGDDFAGPDDGRAGDEPPFPETARRSAFSFARARSAARCARIAAMRSACGTSKRCCGLAV
jgi:hypothetical protein